jgi:hypothetical protein
LTSPLCAVGDVRFRPVTNGKHEDEISGTYR